MDDQKFQRESQASQIFRVVYAECVHSIWIERNKRVFEKSSRGWESIAREIAYICNVRASPRIKNVLQKYMF